jgi:biopolymer transport protein ExbD
MNWIAHLDVIVLSLMLAYVVGVLIHVSCRYHIARRERETDTTSPAFQLTRRKLAADLSVEVGNIKSIASTAPYLGLAGTCIGILSAFRGIGMEKHAAMVMTTTYIAASLITTATGLLVAVSAVWSHNYLRVRIDLLESEIPRIAQLKSRYYQVAQKLPLTARFSKLPFAVIAAPGLAILVVVWMPFFSPREPTGFRVELASTRCEYDGNDRRIVLRISDAGRVFLNQEQEDWDSLSSRLSEVYGMRIHRTLYLLADDGAPFQTVADALDTVENAPVKAGSQVVGMGMGKLDITVRLVTPRALNTRCPDKVVSAKSRGC